VESVNTSDWVMGTNVLWIEHEGTEEFIAFQEVAQADGSLTLSILAHGCLDTAPTAFPAGVRVWFVSYGNGVVNMRGPVDPIVTINNYVPPLSFGGGMSSTQTGPRTNHKSLRGTDGCSGRMRWPGDATGETPRAGRPSSADG
jgi:hypothetical protein